MELEGSLPINDKGLHLPTKYAEKEGGLVVRTPASTIDMQAYPASKTLGFIDEHQFDVEPGKAQNANLCPDRISLMRHGEEPTYWSVAFVDADSSEVEQ